MGNPYSRNSKIKSSYSNTCGFVLSSGERCGKPLGYKMGTDDDENKVRVYDSFCKEHQKWVDENDDDWD